MADLEYVDELRPGDVESLSALMPQVVSRVDGDIGTNAQRVLEEDSSQLIVVRAGSSGIVGALVVNLLPKLVGLEGRINDVVVDERARGQGFGRMLCEAALEEMRRSGAYKAELSSRPARIEANSLYRSIMGEPRETNVYTTYLK